LSTTLCSEWNYRLSEGLQRFLTQLWQGKNFVGIKFAAYQRKITGDGVMVNSGSSADLLLSLSLN
jgi:hypothetical protein